MTGRKKRSRHGVFYTVWVAFIFTPALGQVDWIVGAPAPGMNAAIRATVRLGLDRGHTVLGIYNGTLERILSMLSFS